MLNLITKNIILNFSYLLLKVYQNVEKISATSVLNCKVYFSQLLSKDFYTV